MTPEQQLKLRFETFVFYPHNSNNEDLKRCKNANKYFFDNETGLTITCEMIIKMQKPMYSILPPSNNAEYDKQFNRLNEIIKQCKEYLKDIEKEKLLPL